nr:wiskott-Aldrich syndrome protein homolog 1-like [Aegilops tauschii subsp. strangulata]
MTAFIAGQKILCPLFFFFHLRLTPPRTRPLAPCFSYSAQPPLPRPPRFPFALAANACSHRPCRRARPSRSGLARARVAAPPFGRCCSLLVRPYLVHPCSPRPPARPAARCCARPRPCPATARRGHPAGAPPSAAATAASASLLAALARADLCPLARARRIAQPPLTSLATTTRRRWLPLARPRPPPTGGPCCLLESLSSPTRARDPWPLRPAPPSPGRAPPWLADGRAAPSACVRVRTVCVCVRLVCMEAYYLKNEGSTPPDSAAIYY